MTAELTIPCKLRLEGGALSGPSRDALRRYPRWNGEFAEKGVLTFYPAAAAFVPRNGNPATVIDYADVVVRTPHRTNAWRSRASYLLELDTGDRWAIEDITDSHTTMIARVFDDAEVAA